MLLKLFRDLLIFSTTSSRRDYALALLRIPPKRVPLHDGFPAKKESSRESISVREAMPHQPRGCGQAGPSQQLRLIPQNYKDFGSTRRG
jgi:hypothetical protein